MKIPVSNIYLLAIIASGFGWCAAVAQDQPVAVNPQASRQQDDYQKRDADGSGELSLEEFLKSQSAEQQPRLKRDFGVVDFNRDGRLSWDEFRALPGQPLSDRGPVPDPLQTLASERWAAWKLLLPTRDQNLDGGLAEAEWPREMLKSWGPLGAVPFATWDVDQNGVVTADEAQQVIDWACGIRRSDGSPLRRPWGVVDLLYIAYVDADQDGVVSRAEFSSKYGNDPANAAKIFDQRDRNQNGRWEWEELYAGTEINTDSVNLLVHYDTNLNGTIDQSEVEARAQSWQKRLVPRLVAAFDDEGDGQLSLAEFRMTPFANLLTDWFVVRIDADDDGKLSFPEFYTPAKGESPAYLVQLAYEQFRRWDRNHDAELSSDEYDFSLPPPKTPRDDFRRRDADRSSMLSLDEFLSNQAMERHLRLKRDFGVVDFDRDFQLSWDEFRALPNIPINDRGPVPDPLQNLANERWEAWNYFLSTHDKNQDGGLANAEWPHETLKSWGPIGVVPFATWDVDQTGIVTAAEAQQVIDWAFGIRWSNGSPLRLPAGAVVDLMALANFDVNRDGVLSRAEFVEKYYSGVDKNAEIFTLRDLNADGELEWTEILASREILTDTLGNFLHLDTDLNGLVNQSEMDERVAGWQKKLARRVVAAFDDDGDDQLSLPEYRATPIANLSANWYGVRIDHDDDGKLSFPEFHTVANGESPAYLVQFAYDQFRHWDRDHDGNLSAEEYDFTLPPPKTPRSDFQRRDADRSGDLSLEEFLATQATEQHPRLNRDFGWVDFNHDSRLSFEEFRALPRVPFADRGPVPDPLQILADEHVQAWRLLLIGSDLDHDGGLSASEWPREALLKWGPIGEIPYPTWDADHSGAVTPSEAQRMIECAYGIRRSNGAPLRLPSGMVADLLHTAYLDSNKDGVVSQAEVCSKSKESPEKAVEAFSRRDRNQNSRWDWDELANDTVDQFLFRDTNLNGSIDQSEVNAKAPDWQQNLVRRLVAAFDDDRDGQLSFAEFRVTPAANLVHDWFGIREDRDFDGKLSFLEFYVPAKGESPAYLVQLAYEQFRRWDRNHDNGLSSEEYDITTNTKNISKLTDPVLVFRLADKNHDGALTNEEAFIEPNSDPKNTSAVMDFHRRKMRSGEAFFSADKNRDQRLNLDEYRRYREVLEQVGTKPRAAAPIPPRVVSHDWGEILAYGFTGLNVLLALVGVLYWARHRKGKAK